MTSFAHIINPVSQVEHAELFHAQQTTFNSILKAKSSTPGDIRVDLHTTQYSTDGNYIPAGFSINHNLQRSVCDVAQFLKKRKLPVLKDILDSLYEHSSAEYLVYTNLDICLMPFFYETINEYVKQGHDAFIINRRRISSIYEKGKDLSLMYAEAGKTHTGYDTFVFKRELYPQFVLKNICIGAPMSGNDLFYNIFCFAQNPKLFTDKHLTFHIGMDLYKEWAGAEYERHNQKEMLAIIKELTPKLSIAKFPGAELGFFKRHFKWLMNPTLHYPTMAKLDLKDLGRKKVRVNNDPQKTFKARYLEWLVKRINFD